MDDDAEEVDAFGGSTDLLVVLNAPGYVLFELVESGRDVEGVADGVDEDTVRIEDEDGDFKVGVDLAVGGAKKCDVGWIDGVADAVATKRSVYLVGENVAGSRIRTRPLHGRYIGAVPTPQISGNLSLLLVGVAGFAVLFLNH